MELAIVDRVFDIIEGAKNIEFYPLANLAYAALLDRHFLEPRNDLLTCEWATDDPEGLTAEASYYDLLNLKIVTATGERRVNIPVPIINPLFVISALKHAKIVERGPHNRETREEVEGERASLIAQLQALLTENEARSACKLLQENAYLSEALLEGWPAGQAVYCLEERKPFRRRQAMPDAIAARLRVQSDEDIGDAELGTDPAE